MKYTFSDEDEDTSDALSTRRSTRRGTPTDNRPVVTASGRQVRSRLGGVYGESLLSGQNGDFDPSATGDYERSDASEGPNGRAARGRVGVPQRSHRKHIEGYNSIDEMDDEDEADEWDGGDDDDEDDLGLNDDDEDSMGDDESDDEIYVKPKGSLIVTLRVRSDRLAAASSPIQQPSSPPALNEQIGDKMDIDVAPSTDMQASTSGEASLSSIQNKAQPVFPHTQPAPQPASSEQVHTESIAKLPSPPASINLKPELQEVNGKVEDSTLDATRFSAQQPLLSGHATSNALPRKLPESAMPDASSAYTAQ